MMILLPSHFPASSAPRWASSCISHHYDLLQEPEQNAHQTLWEASTVGGEAWLPTRHNKQGCVHDLTLLTDDPYQNNIRHLQAIHLAADILKHATKFPENIPSKDVDLGCEVGTMFGEEDVTGAPVTLAQILRDVKASEQAKGEEKDRKAQLQLPRLDAEKPGSTGASHSSTMLSASEEAQPRRASDIPPSSPTSEEASRSPDTSRRGSLPTLRRKKSSLSPLPPTPSWLVGGASSSPSSSRASHSPEPSSLPRKRAESSENVLLGFVPSVPSAADWQTRARVATWNASSASVERHEHLPIPSTSPSTAAAALPSPSSLSPGLGRNRSASVSPNPSSTPKDADAKKNLSSQSVADILSSLRRVRASALSAAGSDRNSISTEASFALSMGGRTADSHELLTPKDINFHMSEEFPQHAYNPHDPNSPAAAHEALGFVSTRGATSQEDAGAMIEQLDRDSPEAALFTSGPGARKTGKPSLRLRSRDGKPSSDSTPSSVSSPLPSPNASVLLEAMGLAAPANTTAGTEDVEPAEELSTIEASEPSRRSPSRATLSFAESIARSNRERSQMAVNRMKQAPLRTSNAHTSDGASDTSSRVDSIGSDAVYSARSHGSGSFAHLGVGKSSSVQNLLRPQDPNRPLSNASSSAYHTPPASIGSSSSLFTHSLQLPSRDSAGSQVHAHAFSSLLRAHRRSSSVPSAGLPHSPTSVFHGSGEAGFLDEDEVDEEEQMERERQLRSRGIANALARLEATIQGPENARLSMHSLPSPGFPSGLTWREPPSPMDQPKPARASPSADSDSDEQRSDSWIDGMHLTRSSRPPSGDTPEFDGDTTIRMSAKRASKGSGADSAAYRDSWSSLLSFTAEQDVGEIAAATQILPTRVRNKVVKGVIADHISPHLRERQYHFLETSAGSTSSTSTSSRSRLSSSTQSKHRSMSSVSSIPKSEVQTLLTGSLSASSSPRSSSVVQHRDQVASSESSSTPSFSKRLSRRMTPSNFGSRSRSNSTSKSTSAKQLSISNPQVDRTDQDVHGVQHLLERAPRVAPQPPSVPSAAMAPSAPPTSEEQQGTSHWSSGSDSESPAPENKGRNSMIQSLRRRASRKSLKRISSAAAVASDDSSPATAKSGLFPLMSKKKSGDGAQETPISPSAATASPDLSGNPPKLPIPAQQEPFGLGIEIPFDNTNDAKTGSPPKATTVGVPGAEDYRRTSEISSENKNNKHASLIASLGSALSTQAEMTPKVATRQLPDVDADSGIDKPRIHADEVALKMLTEEVQSPSWPGSPSPLAVDHAHTVEGNSAAAQQRQSQPKPNESSTSESDSSSTDDYGSASDYAGSESGRKNGGNGDGEDPRRPSPHGNSTQPVDHVEMKDSDDEEEDSEDDYGPAEIAHSQSDSSEDVPLGEKVQDPRRLQQHLRHHVRNELVARKVSSTRDRTVMSARDRNTAEPSRGMSSVAPSQITKDLERKKSLSSSRAAPSGSTPTVDAQDLASRLKRIQIISGGSRPESRGKEQSVPLTAKTLSRHASLSRRAPASAEPGPSVDTNAPRADIAMQRSHSLRAGTRAHQSQAAPPPLPSLPRHLAQVIGSPENLLNEVTTPGTPAPAPETSSHRHHRRDSIRSIHSGGHPPSHEPSASPKSTTIVSHKVFIITKQRYVNVEIRQEARARDLVVEALSKAAVSTEDPSPGGWVIFDVSAELGIERPLREYEFISEVAEKRASQFRDYFLLRRTELATYLSARSVPSASPALAGYVYVQDRKKKWNKRWVELRDHSLYHAKSEKGKDEEPLCHMSSFDVYLVQPSHMKTPKAHAFALRSQDSISLFEKPDQDYVHYLCLSDAAAHRDWIKNILNARTYVLRQERAALFSSFAPPSSDMTTSHDTPHLKHAARTKASPTLPSLKSGATSASQVPPSPLIGPDAFRGPFEEGSLLADVALKGFLSNARPTR